LEELMQVQGKVGKKVAELAPTCPLPFCVPDSTEILDEFSSFQSQLSRDDMPIPVLDEMSPLLRHEHSQGTKENPSGRWNSVASAFVNRDTGLLLVAGSQLFFSVMLVL
jgi:hypothetical protein